MSGNKADDNGSRQSVQPGAINIEQEEDTAGNWEEVPDRQMYQKTKRSKKSGAKLRRETARRQAYKSGGILPKSSRKERTRSTPSPATPATPANETMRQRPDDMSLQMAIFNANEPGGKLSAESAAIIRKSLEEVLHELAVTSQKCPCFTYTKYTGEFIKMGCADADGKQWLINTVAALKCNSLGHFKVVEMRMMPVLTKVTIFLRDRQGNIGGAQTLLAVQNPELEVRSWHLLRISQKEDGLLVMLGVPEKDVELLERRNCEVSFLFQTFQITLPPEHDMTIDFFQINLQLR